MDRLLRTLQSKDALAALALSALLAWPLWFVSFPPYQDLYGHGATIEILRRIGDYPEFEASGYFRSNACITTLGVFCTRFMSIASFMKAFSTATIYASSFALLRFLRAFRPADARLVVWPFLPPLAHHWFISMGMHNYALGFALTLLVIAEAKIRENDAISAGSTVTGLLLALAIFFCHPLPSLLGAPFGLAVCYAHRKDAALSRAYVRRLLPVFVAAALSCGSFAVHFLATKHDRAHIIGAGIAEAPAWNEPAWIAYDAFAQSLWGMTTYSAASVVACAFLVYYALFTGGTDSRLRMLFAFGLAIYVVTPYRAFGVYAGSPRVLLFLWPIALLALPKTFARPARTVLVVSAAAYVLGMNVDVFRLAKEGDGFARAGDVLPERAQVLPLIFATRKISENTRNFDSISSMYVWQKHTNAVDVWDHSSAYPIVRVKQPPANMTRKRILDFEAKADLGAFRADCSKQGVGIEACAANFHHVFANFFAEVAPAYSHVVLYAAPVDAEEAATPFYHVAYRDHELVVLERNAR